MVVTPDSPEADTCAAEAFRAAEALTQSAQHAALSIPSSTSPERALRLLVDGVRAECSRTQRIASQYERVLSWCRPEWTVAAYTRQGELYEDLAAWVATSAATTATLTPGSHAGRVAASLAPQLRPVECLAVVRYLRAVREAREEDVRGAVATTALGRLVAFGVSEISECVSEQQRRDPTFAPLTLADLRPPATE